MLGYGTCTCMKIVVVYFVNKVCLMFCVVSFARFGILFIEICFSMHPPLPIERSTN